MSKIMTAACMALLLAACEKISEIDDTSVIAENTRAFESCLKDRRACQGGFVKWSDGEVVRIDTSCSNNCPPSTMSFNSIQVRMNMNNRWLPKTVHWVALPSDVVAWEKAAVEYERQFVARH